MTPERYRRLREVLARRQPDLTVLMNGVHKPHNLSAILRNCDAVGVLEAHAVPAPGTAITLHHDTAAGTEKWVRVRIHETTRHAMDVLRVADFRIFAAHPSAAADDFRQADFTGPTAFVVGAELHGLGEDTLEMADAHVSIPMMGMGRSLNVSVATSLLLHEAMRQRERSGMYGSPRLAPDLLERMLFEWAYPKVAAERRRRGLPYPVLGPDGELPPRAEWARDAGG